jgi:hypothetical protein
VMALTSNPYWIFLSALAGLGLTLAGLTDLCPMASALEKMPWNRWSACGNGVPHSGPSEDRP